MRYIIVAVLSMALLVGCGSEPPKHNYTVSITGQTKVVSVAPEKERAILEASGVEIIMTQGSMFYVKATDEAINAYIEKGNWAWIRGDYLHISRQLQS